MAQDLINDSLASPPLQEGVHDSITLSSASHTNLLLPFRQNDSALLWPINTLQSRGTYLSAEGLGDPLLEYMRYRKWRERDVMQLPVLAPAR